MYSKAFTKHIIGSNKPDTNHILLNSHYMILEKKINVQSEKA